MEFTLPLTDADLIETARNLTPDETRKIITPTSDIFARYLFSSEHLKHLTLSFINAVRSDAGLKPATSVTLKNPFCLRDSVVIKETILDVEVEETDGVIYDVEIQNKPSADFFPRIQYYAANLYHKQIHRSDEYTDLRPCMEQNFLTVVYEGRFSHLLSDTHRNAKFFATLAYDCLFVSFARFLLAAGEFPSAAHLTYIHTMCDENFFV